MGAEYIIEEKAEGQQLGSMWSQCSKDSQVDVVNQINETETKLATLSFSKRGSIYYKSDLEARHVSYEPLDSSIAHMAVSPNENRSTEFCHWAID